MQKKQAPAGFSFRRIMVSGAAGLGLTALLLLAAAGLVERGALAAEGRDGWALAALFGGCLAAAFSAARRGKLPAALAACALMALVLLILGGALMTGAFDGLRLLTVCGVLLLAAAAGTALAGLTR